MESQFFTKSEAFRKIGKKFRTRRIIGRLAKHTIGEAICVGKENDTYEIAIQFGPPSPPPLCPRKLVPQMRYFEVRWFPKWQFEVDLEEVE